MSKQATRLSEREDQVDNLLQITPEDQQDSLRLEKTIIIAARAIIEALWGARY